MRSWFRCLRSATKLWCRARATNTRCQRWICEGTRVRSRARQPKPFRRNSNGVLMRFCRFQASGEIRYGLIEHVDGQDVIRRAVASLPTSEVDFRCGEAVEGPLSAVHLLAPV